MAAQNSTPSDLYKCVYSFLLENKFTKAAQQFLKQTKVVSGSAGAAVKLIGCSVGVLEVVERTSTEHAMVPGVSTRAAAGTRVRTVFRHLFFFFPLKNSSVLNFSDVITLSQSLMCRSI